MLSCDLSVTYIFLSLFVFCLTLLFLSWYSCRSFAFLVSSASLLSFILITLLDSIASHVSSVIQSFLLASWQPRTCSHMSLIAFLHLAHFLSMFSPLPMLGTCPVVRFPVPVAFEYFEVFLSQTFFVPSYPSSSLLLASSDIHPRGSGGRSCYSDI